LNLSDGQQIFKNIFSSGTAKGLEFDRVIIYKFGEEIDNIMQHLIDTKDNGKRLDENEDIKIAYFFNKLYVAITRAKQKLIIIDSERGEKNLWKYFEEKNHYNKNISEKDREKWDKKIGFIIDGNPQNISENIKEREPKEIAEELEKVGKERNEPELLERAAKYYEGLNENKKALKCQARALYLKQKWYEAGMKYKELEENSEASNCFWKGQNWDELFILHENHTKSKWKIRYEISEFMLDTSVEYAQILKKDIIDEIEGDDPSDKTWITVVEELKDRLENIKFETRVPEHNDKEGSSSYGKSEKIYLEIAGKLKKLAGFGFEFLWDLSAEYYFKGKNYNEAIECWENLENITSSSYYKAKACNISEINEKINWLNKMPWENEIIKEWRHALNRTEYSITDNTATIILRALKRNKLFQEAFNVSVRHNFIKEALEIYRESIHNQESNVIKDECSNKLLDNLFTQREWKKYTGLWNKLLLDLPDEFILKTVDKTLEKIGEDANILFDVINYSTWVKIPEDNLGKLETEEIFIINEKNIKQLRDVINKEELDKVKFSKYSILKTEEINKILEKAGIKSEDIQKIKDITKFAIQVKKLKKLNSLLEIELLQEKLIEHLTKLNFSKYEIDVILSQRKPVENDKTIYIKDKFLKAVSKSDITPL
ncbi:MAG: 3'-5' exonuclease, partial [Candidatus Eremiobacterota bacterium]